ncbi:MAG: ABC transporter transmembrane domain-containing protein [Saprospiraceae bacterium]|nr:ABC transporter transmembrane domain-containing protein [Saprospiraceae bacterium]MDW8484438.1 ABC transporter transmembrane domain-containing protein [Saprospiraceae bacterium]
MNSEKTQPRITRESLQEALYLFQFIRPYRFHFVAGLILLFLSSGVFMLFPYLVGIMLDVAQGVVLEFDLKHVGARMAIILVFQGVISYWRIKCFAVVSERTTADIRLALYERLIALPIVFFERNRVGELVSRLTNDVERMYNLLYFVLAEFIRQCVVLLGGVVLLTWMSPRLAGVMLLTFPVIVIGAIIFGRWVRRLSRQRQDVLGEVNTILDETLQSIHAVKAFANEAFERLRYGRVNERVVNISMRAASSRALFAVFIVTILFGTLFFILGFGMYLVQTKQMTAGELIAFITYTAVVGGAIAGLSTFYTELIGALGATERIRAILRTPAEKEERPQVNRQAQRLNADIRLLDVHFAYPTRPDVEVLKGVTMTIPAGKKVALVGQSGAGKSTIMHLLLQFHRPQRGDIRIGGVSIYDYELSSYRSNFALVPQEVILFGGTIRENIRYGRPDAHEEEVIEAARKANALEFIQQFPDGLDTVVGERGIRLSGGQRQRIAIARAILRDPAILLLDEATSSLDAESERVVQEALDNLMEGRTSIIIAHRLATVRSADLIYVLDGGRIVEQGTHDELMARENGLYSSLARLQFNLTDVATSSA